MVKIEEITFKVGTKELLHPTSLTFTSNRFHVIMGANGAGKSTLIKMLSGNHHPTSGKVFLQDKGLQEYSSLALAKKRAVLSQHYAITFPITVKDIVVMGRYPYFKSIPTANDLSICKKAMQLMEVEEFADRDYNTLSGGEAQKVQMSRVLAQIWSEELTEERVLFLDEPVSHLDVKYQYQLLRVAKELCQQNVTIIAILHDINLALSFADRILFMKKGSVIYDLQDPSQITPKMVMEVFGMPSKIIHDEQHPRPLVIF